jgi:hypothetical protein
MIIVMKLCVVTRPKFLKNLNNLFKQLFIMHLTYILCKISVVEYSTQSFDWTIL